MTCELSIRHLGAAVAAVALSMPPAFAFADATLVQKGLNALMAVSTVSDANRPAACEEIRSARNSLDAALASEPTLSGLRQQVTKAENIFCSVREDGVDQDPLVQINPLVWQEQPHCIQDSRKVYKCSYNHDRGRGMFIYERPTPPVLQHYLVCAQSAGESSGMFGSGYSITSRCVVSTLDWYAYVRLDPQMRIRSDVRGVLRWENGSALTRPIQLPRFLAEQCSSAFPEAIHCSPTLMILPTTNADLVDVCGLHSERRAFGLQFIQISSASSRWKCTRADLRVQTPDENPHSVRESECIPDFTGMVDASCDLPFLPRQQYPIHVKRDD
jgi:hypothetical protein